MSGERRFAGGRRDKLWTFFIVGGLLLGAILVVNYVLINPSVARRGVSRFMGMPSWVYPIIASVVGLVIYWLGLKLETDWPEVLGAALIAGSIYWGEVMLGWRKFALGGLAAFPVILPLSIFLVLVVIAMVKSK